MNFFRRNKQVESVSPSAQAKQNQQANENRPPLQNRPGAPAYQVISKKDDIPLHVSVLSISGGPIELSPDLQKNYAVLLTSREGKEVEVICTLDVVKRAGLDDEYMAIVDRLKRQGYKRARSKLLARPEILQIIYEQTEQRKTLEEQQKAASEIQKSFDELLLRAVKSGASDIHMEVRRDAAQIRMRINGDLGDPEPWAVRNANTMAGVIYMVIADEKDTAFDPARPQDAIIDRELGDGVRIRVRLATLPAYPSGFDMIMRLLKMGQSGENINLDKLGYNKEQLTKTRRAVAKPTGAIIMAGTTGSGKSTSLNAMLSEKIAAHGGRIKVITVEDPPEYLLHGATQVPVVRSRSAAKSGDAKENPFAAAVRATMRSDPDIIMVGEVRDVSSAELLIHAVQSGHQVYTTTHASSGIDIVARLRSQHVPDDVLGSQNFIAALMYQALLPVVCPACSTNIEAFKKTVSSENDEDMVSRIYRHLGNNQAQMIRFRNHSGCPECKQGVIGRTVASEIILPNAFMLRAFRNRQDMDAIMYHAHTGGKIALHHGIEKLIKGLVDIRDVEHKLDQISFLQELKTSVREFVTLTGLEATLAEAEQASGAHQEESGIYLPESELILPATEKPADVTPQIILPDYMAKPVAALAPEKAPEPVVESQVEVTALVETPTEHFPSSEVIEPLEEQISEVPASGNEVVLNFELDSRISPEDSAESLSEAAQEAVLDVEQPIDVVQVVQDEIIHLAGFENTPGDSQVVDVEPEVLTPALPEAVQAVDALVAMKQQAEPEPDLENEAEQVEPTIAGPQPMISHDCEATFLDALQAVLETEVARNGFSLTPRFFKGRLSEPAISALLGSDLVPEQKAMDLRDAFGALTQEERQEVFSLSIEKIQGFLESKHSAPQSPVVIERVELAPVPSAVVTSIGSKAKPKAKAKKSPATVTDAASASQAPATAVTEPAAKPARAYKSKLLTGGEPKTEVASKDNVKSLDAARAQKTQKTATKAPAKTASKPAAKPAQKAATKAAPKKPVKKDQKDQSEE